VPRYAFNVVTEDLRSLGLRNNPTILEYEVGVWVRSPQAIRGRVDSGGVWAARTLCGARGLARYMLREHGVQTRVFRSEIGDVIRENTYRVKTDRIRLLEEII